MTHHDVTLEQKCRFDGHTQPPAASALKVTADNAEDTNKSVRELKTQTRNAGEMPGDGQTASA